MTAVVRSLVQSRPRQMRHGYTLMEVIIAISLISGVLGACVTMLAMAMRLDLRSRGAATAALAKDSFVAQFRSDVAQAERVTIVPQKDSGTSLEIEFAGGIKTVYRFERLSILRDAQRGASRGYERYRLASPSQARLEAFDAPTLAGSTKFISLTIEPIDELGKPAAGRGWTLEAAIGRDASDSTKASAEPGASQ